MLLIFLFWIISFKVCTNASIVPSFCSKIRFNPFLLGGFKMNDTVSFEDICLYNLSGYQTIFFHSNYVIPILLCLVLMYR